MAIGEIVMKLRIALALSLIIFAVSSRLMPHPANFAPIAAVAIFGGAVLPRKWAIALPLAAMVLSDLVIGLHPLIWYTWGSFVLIALASHKYVKPEKPMAILGASVGASIFFYLVTNFGVWAQGQMYSMSFAGLIRCYYMALPFFRNTLFGDLFFTGLLFGLYALVYKLASTSFDTKHIQKSV